MTESFRVSVPDDVTFEQAIALTQTILDQMQQETISETELEQAIAALVQTQNGARGFFVTYLTHDRPFADHPSDGVIQALTASPDTVAELLVKNLAMSTAMAITHRRNQHEEMAQGSDRVRSRTANLIHRLDMPEVNHLIRKLHSSAATGTGEYQAFLSKWGYDAEQRQRIVEAIEALGFQDCGG